MADKMINQLNEGELADEQDLFIFQSSIDDETYKIPWGSIVQYLLDNHIVEGTNITLTKTNGVLTISSSVTITIDSMPTSGSDNAVSSGGVYTGLSNLGNGLNQLQSGKQDKLTFDNAPTQNSPNSLTSGAVWTALQNISPAITVDATPTSGSNNPVASGGVYTALQGKQDTLTFDTAPTVGSNNPVTSNGIREALNDLTPLGVVDPTPTSGSNNAVSSGGTYTALQSKEDKIAQSATLTLLSSGWNASNEQTVSFVHDTAMRNVIDIVPSEVPTWGEKGVYAISETANDITFKCMSIPSVDLTFKVTSMEVS